MTSDELAAYVYDGAGVIVATRNASLEPYLSRALGAVVHDDGLVTLYIPNESGGRCFADLREDGSPLAAVITYPTTYRSYQLKGDFVGLRPTNAIDQALQRQLFSLFLDELERIGVPRALAAYMGHGTTSAVTMRVREVFQQSPGTGAGARL